MCRHLLGAGRCPNRVKTRSPPFLGLCQLPPATDMPPPEAMCEKCQEETIIIAAELLFILRAELQSIDVFLNHAQMDPESLQVDFEWACNLE